jgi:hypothetical protein
VDDHWSHPVPQALQRHTGCQFKSPSVPSQSAAADKPPAAPQPAPRQVAELAAALTGLSEAV